jgi:hypothetical protein
VNVVSKYKTSGILSSDGCSFIEYLNMIKSGSWSSRYDSKISNQKKLIEAYKTIAFDYVNVHYSIKDNVLDSGFIKAGVDYLRTQTGKEVISNEYHFENATSAGGIVPKAVSEWKKAGVLICILWSGEHIEGTPPLTTGSGADAFTTGQNLTKLGEQYRDAIK